MLENKKTATDQSKPFQTQTKDKQLFAEINEKLKNIEINSFADIVNLLQCLSRIINYQIHGFFDFEKITPNIQGITVKLCGDSLKLLTLKHKLKIPINDLRNFLLPMIRKIKKSDDSTGIQRNKKVLKTLYEIYKEILLLQKGQNK